MWTAYSLELSFFDHDDLPAYYDFSTGRAEGVNLAALHNRIIHSFVFEFVGNDGG